MEVKFYEKEGREYFSFVNDEIAVDTYADEAHKKNYPAEYKEFKKSLDSQISEEVSEEIKELTEKVVSGEIDIIEAITQLPEKKTKKGAK